MCWKERAGGICQMIEGKIVFSRLITVFRRLVEQWACVCKQTLVCLCVVSAFVVNSMG